MLSPTGILFRWPGPSIGSTTAARCPRLRGRHDDAVRALRTAEGIFPTMVLREPKVRDTLAVLLRHSRRGSPADQVLRGMARRAGLRRVAHSPTGMSFLRDRCGPVSPGVSCLSDNPL